MSTIPKQLRFTASHEWIRQEADGALVIGITDHAQEQLGELVFVELPEPDTEYPAGAECAVVESVKAAADVYCPLGGVVLAVNQALDNDPQLVNTDPYGDGWLFRLRPNGDANDTNLLDASAYSEIVAGETH